MDPLTKLSNQVLKVEARLAFMMQKHGTEVSRRPTDQEVVEGQADPNTRVITKKSWDQEFLEKWAEFVKASGLEEG